MKNVLKKLGQQYKFSKGGLSFREKLTLALPGPASVIGPIIIHNALIKFYTDIIGIDPKYIGWIYLIYNIWNAINDPLLGTWVDRLKYNKKRGKYVYLMRCTAPLMMISIFGMLFSSPTWNDWLIFGVLLFELFIFDTAYTVYSVAYQSYFLIAAPSKEERVDVDIIRTFIGNALGCVTTIIPTLLLVGNGKRSLIIPIFSGVIVINALMYLLALSTLKDKGELYANEKHDEHRPFSEVWKEAWKIIKSRAFLSYLIFYIFARGAMEYYFTPFLYFMDDVVKSNGIVATVADVVPGLIMLAVLPVFGNLIKKYGSKNMTLISYIPAVIGFAGLLFIRQAWQAVICYTLIVLALNVTQRAGVVINGDLIDDDERRTGVRKTGMYGGIFSLFATSLTSIQSLIFTNVISHFGYQGELAEQSERAVMGIRIGAGLVPLIMLAIGLAALLFFPINRKEEKELSDYFTNKQRHSKKIRVEGRKFFDEEGNEITPHGVNMVCKDKSRNYMGGYTSEDFKRLKDLGFNLVRLGIFWDGVEPEPGKYNEEYLSKVDSVIKLAAENDICVFLDMHQDLYSAEFEDGAPGWATITNGNEYQKTELWSDAYLMCPAVQIAFDNFWNNTAAPDGIGLQDHYEAMWKMLAKRYSTFPNVIGYDVLNEPFPGTAANGVVEALFGTVAQLLQVEDPAIVMSYFEDAQKKTELFEKIGTPENLMKLVSAIEPVTAAFEENCLNPFYEKIGKAIWSEDKNALLMLENNYFSNAGIPSHVQPVKNADGTAHENQVYAPHGYDIFVDTDMYDTSDFTRIDLIFETHKAVAAALELPVIVGEWGCYPQALPSQLEQAKHLLAVFKEMGAGNTYYEFEHVKNKLLAETLKGE